MRYQQQAILVSQDNAEAIAATLSDYTTEDIMDELLNPKFQYVLVRYVHPGDRYYVSHIITESMFWANATTVTETINDRTFTEVVQL